MLVRLLLFEKMSLECVEWRLNDNLNVFVTYYEWRNQKFVNLYENRIQHYERTDVRVD